MGVERWEHNPDEVTEEFWRLAVSDDAWQAFQKVRDARSAGREIEWEPEAGAFLDNTTENRSTE